MLGLRHISKACAASSWSALSVRSLHKTVLYDFHVERGAKMVEFAGYSMPLLYGKVSAAVWDIFVREFYFYIAEKINYFQWNF